jgi:tetratricopeptide (TPR) repeat protein
MNRKMLAVLAAALLIPSLAAACLWDYDTLEMERSRFPSNLELITGKFLRHSKEFYEWRIKDRQKRLESDPENLALIDDLAVAFDKTGQHDKAIELMTASLQKKPNRYESLANLGTFLIHAGKPKTGLKYIDKAIATHPNAHFGREKYQKALVEYVMLRRTGRGNKLPLCSVHQHTHNPEAVAENFYDFLGRHNKAWTAAHPYYLTADENAAAIKGVLGMMRFGKHDSPILLEALGNLLAPGPLNDSSFEDGKRLAARAYLKAAYEINEADPKENKDSSLETYRNLARNAIEWQARTPRSDVYLPFEELEEDFKKELMDANSWYKELCERERSWIKENKNPEWEFSRLYSEDPSVESPPPPPIPSAISRFFEIMPTRLLVAISIGTALVGGILFWKIFSRVLRRAHPSRVSGRGTSA